MSNKHQENHEFLNNQDEALNSNNEASIGGASASASTSAYGGTGGNGGTGGAGGQALNITYVDNYSMFMFMYSILLLLMDGKTNESREVAADKLLPLLKSVMDEQREYRQAFLEAIQTMKP